MRWWRKHGVLISENAAVVESVSKLPIGFSIDEIIESNYCLKNMIISAERKTNREEPAKAKLNKWLDYFIRVKIKVVPFPISDFTLI